MNFNWNASNYEVVAFFVTFPMIGCKFTLKWTKDDYDCKKVQNTCFLKEFGPFPMESTLLLKEGAFSSRNIHVDEVKLLQGCLREQPCAQGTKCVQILYDHNFCIWILI
jgi:hypothetical protein